MKRYYRQLALALVSILLGACGQPGALYLPQKPMAPTFSTP